MGALIIDFFEPVNDDYLCLLVVSVSVFILYRLGRARRGWSAGILARSRGDRQHRRQQLAVVEGVLGGSCGVSAAP